MLPSQIKISIYFHNMNPDNIFKSNNYISLKNVFSVFPRQPVESVGIWYRLSITNFLLYIDVVVGDQWNAV